SDGSRIKRKAKTESGVAAALDQARSATAAARAFHVLEELRRGIDHGQVLLVAEAAAISHHAAPELGELRITAKRLGVNRCRATVTLALQLLRIAIGLGQNDLTLAIGISTDLLALRSAGGAQFVGYALALSLHPAIHGFADLGEQV